jgi:hypothetical protein
VQVAPSSAPLHSSKAATAMVVTMPGGAFRRDVAFSGRGPAARPRESVPRSSEMPA